MLLAISHHMMPLPLRPRRFIHWTRSFSMESGVSLKIFLSFCTRKKKWPLIHTQPLSATEFINCRKYRYGVWKCFCKYLSVDWCYIFCFWVLYICLQNGGYFSFASFQRMPTTSPKYLVPYASFHVWKFQTNGFKPTIEEFDSRTSQT